LLKLLRIFLSEATGQLEPNFAGMMFVRSSTKIPHLYLAKYMANMDNTAMLGSD